MELEIREVASLKPGGIYLLRLKDPMKQQCFEEIKAYLSQAMEKVGCKFILLDSSIDLVMPIEIAPQQATD